MVMDLHIEDQIK